MPKKKNARGYSDDENFIAAQKDENAIIIFDEDNNDYTVEYKIPEANVEVVVEKYIDCMDTYIKYSNTYTRLHEYCAANGITHVFDRCTREKFVYYCSIGVQVQRS